jgi:hypothetical protein
MTTPHQLTELGPEQKATLRQDKPNAQRPQDNPKNKNLHQAQKDTTQNYHAPKNKQRLLIGNAWASVEKILQSSF